MALAIKFEVTAEEFQKFRDLLYRESGIKLGDHKQPLLVTRLSRRLRHFHFDTFGEYFDYVNGEGRANGELVHMLDLLSTNKTDFFREPSHFDFLANTVIPSCQKNKIRIWSSACSSGEEPYSIAMTLVEAIPDIDKWDCKILASDLSTRVLEKAETGIYEKERVSGMESVRLHRHFNKGKSGENAEKVKVKRQLSQMVSFRRINLMDESYPIKNALDLIFCRNVMIYFDKETQGRLIRNFYRYLRPNGYLFIGHSESLHWMDGPFTLIEPTVYQKIEAA